MATNTARVGVGRAGICRGDEQGGVRSPKMFCKFLPLCNSEKDFDIKVESRGGRLFQKGPNSGFTLKIKLFIDLLTDICISMWFEL